LSYLQILAVWELGLMCGSELSVAAFAHPVLKLQLLDAHIAVRASLARLFGRVMPLWMAGSTLLNLFLVLPFHRLKSPVWRPNVIALAIQVLAVLFSLVGPVPINSRVAKWTPGSLPGDWQEQERRWDLYHWLRTCGLIVAFLLLSLGLSAFCQE
jgi:Domain of unknown function (DUF1772)